MKYLYLLFTVLFFNVNSQAQTAKQSIKKGKSFGVISIFNSYQSFDGLKQRIAQRPEYQALNNGVVGFNLGYEYENTGFVVNAELGLGSNFRFSRSQKATSLSTINSGVKIGYNLFHNSKSIRVVPFGGLGVDFFGVRLSRDVSSIPFDSVLRNPILQESLEPVSVNNVFFTYKAGLMIDVALGKKKQDFIGLEAGYTAGFGNSAWRMGNYQLTGNPPRDALQRWYVSLVFKNIIPEKLWDRRNKK